MRHTCFTAVIPETCVPSHLDARSWLIAVRPSPAPQVYRGRTPEGDGHTVEWELLDNKWVEGVRLWDINPYMKRITWASEEGAHLKITVGSGDNDGNEYRQGLSA